MNSKIANILGYALTLMVAVEQALPQTGLGTSKKQIVMAGIDTALKTASAVGQATNNTELATYTSLASTFIDTTVGILNKAGVFSSSSSASKT